MSTDPIDQAQPRSVTRRVLGPVLSVAVITAVVLLAGDAMPSPPEMLAAVRGGDGGWLAAAVMLQVLSVTMLAVQQRRLLGALGTPVGPGRMVAITLASTAVSLTVPAGGAVGAGWSFRQYRLVGASRAAASTVTVVSGLAGAAGLVTLTVVLWSSLRIVHLIAPGGPGLWVTVLVLTVQTAIIWAVSAGWTRWRRRHRARRPGPASTRGQAPVGPFRERVRAEVRGAVAVTRSLGRRAWRDATAASVANRLLDAASLYACCLAMGAQVNVLELALVYIGLQLIRQIPITPGGVGVVEVAMLTGLTSIGVAAVLAAAVVVVYRLIAAWLLVPVGYAALVALRSRPPAAVSAGTDAPPGIDPGFGYPAAVVTRHDESCP